MITKNENILINDMSLTITSTLTQRIHFSSIFINNAALFSRKAFKLENLIYESRKKFDPSKSLKENGPQITEQMFNEHKSYVLGAIIFSVSYLEAFINELFSNAHDSYLEPLEGLDHNTIELMKKLWADSVPRTATFSILNKYNILFDLTNKPSYNRGSIEFSNVKLMIELRNAIVHNEPATMTRHSDGSKNIKSKLEKKLNNKFNETSFKTLHDNELTPFFPEKCLGHGCAEWCVKSSIKFIEWYTKQIEINKKINFKNDSYNTK